MLNFLKRWFTRKQKYTTETLPGYVVLDLVSCVLHDLPLPYSDMEATMVQPYSEILVWHKDQYRILCISELRDRFHSSRQFVRYLQKKLK